MAKVGRPRALDDAKRREVCALVSAGCGLDAASRYVGCSPRTIRREALRNEEFHEALRRAELAAELSPLQSIRQAAGSHWRAAAWLLERINPERYARRDMYLVKPDDVSQVLDTLVESLVGEIADSPDADRIRQRLMLITKEAEQNLYALHRPRRSPRRAHELLSHLRPQQV